MFIIENFFNFGLELGYLGIVLFSFISSVIVFIPIPYFPVLMSAALNKNFDPTLIVLFSTIGAVAGKMIIFCGSYYGRKIILSYNTKKRMLPLQKLLSRYGWMGVFTAAATPIPDDIVYIPLGLAKYSPLKFASALFVGKFILGGVIVVFSIYFGRPFIEYLIAETSKPYLSYHYSSNNDSNNLCNDILFHQDGLGEDYWKMVSLDVRKEQKL